MQEILLKRAVRIKGGEVVRVVVKVRVIGMAGWLKVMQVIWVGWVVRIGEGWSDGEG